MDYKIMYATTGKYLVGTGLNKYGDWLVEVYSDHRMGWKYERKYISAYAEIEDVLGAVEIALNEWDPDGNLDRDGVAA